MSTSLTPDLLRRARLALGMSYQALATAIGVTRGTAYRWDAGQLPVPAALRPKLAVLLRLRRQEIDDILKKID